MAVEDAIVYGIIVILVVYILWIERKDLICPYLGCNSGDCREGNGKAYYGSCPEPSDSIETLLDKILVGSTAVKRDVFWRRALLMSIIAAFTTMALVHRDTFNWHTLIVTILVFFAVIYGFHQFYNFHHHNHWMGNIERCVAQLKN